VREGTGEDPAKYRDQFRRRVASGRCFATPYLGCREFSASFEEPDGSEIPIDRTEDLGAMLLDLEYLQDGAGRGIPRFFPARLERGVLQVPELDPQQEE
jgi:CRISPR-associated protein Cas5d